jgi:KaiC/GvpD/RAD55 family RecA-like ATPase
VNVLKYAQQYVRNGWSVFPVPLGKKEPAIKWKEYQQRHPTEAELQKWFAQGESNLGVVTGAISDLGVIDLDGQIGIMSGRALGLTSIGTVLTGNGRQLYFKNPDEVLKNSVKKLGKNIDVRGEGGYVLAPPSIHPNGKAYRWLDNGMPASHLLPPWPSAQATTSVPVLTPAATISQPSGLPPTTSEAWLSRIIKGVGEGERHQALVKLASYLIGRHPYDYVKHTVLEWNQKCTPPQSESQVLFTLNDIYTRFKKGDYSSTWTGLKETDHEEKTGIEVTHIADYAKDYIDDLKQRKNRPVPELRTGYRELDKWTWGISRGEVYVVGARPGTGKSSFLITVAYRLCKQGKRVLYVSTEMSKSDILDKVAAVALSIPAESIRNGQLSEADSLRIGQFLHGFTGLSIAHTFEPKAEKLAAEVEKHKPDVIIFDHLQHIATGEDIRKDVSRFTRALKSIAMKFHCAVMVASQLTRLLDGEQPELHHLKESGTIEEEAQVAVLLHNEPASDPEMVPTMFKVAKNRYGRPGVLALVFNAKYTRFEEIGESNDAPSNTPVVQQATQGNPQGVLRTVLSQPEAECPGVGGPQLRPDLNV